MTPPCPFTDWPHTSDNNFRDPFSFILNNLQPNPTRCLPVHQLSSRYAHPYTPVTSMSSLKQIEANRPNSHRTAAWPRNWVGFVNFTQAPPSLVPAPSGPARAASTNPFQTSHLYTKLGSFRQFPQPLTPRPPTPEIGLVPSFSPRPRERSEPPLAPGPRPLAPRPLAPRPLAPETGSFTPYFHSSRQHEVLQFSAKAPK
jgi:hypothetical protein